MATSSKSKQVSFLAVGFVWAIVVAAAASLGLRAGFSGRHFEIALGVAAALFAFELFLALPGIQNAVLASFGNRGGILAPLVALSAVLVYSWGVAGGWRMMLIGAAYATVPALLLASSRAKAPGTWEDYAALLILWLPVEFRWMYHLFPYPAPLTHTLTILMALSTGVAAFVLLRRMPGVGYALEWRRGFAFHFGFNFLVFSAIAIPLGLKLGFLHWKPALPAIHAISLSGPAGAALSGIGILLFTAWPEEFLFRGLLQNLLSKSFRSEWTGLVVASVIFGFSHILHAPFPNWKYVCLATIAGFFYGRAWMKTGSLVPGVLIHAAVDTLWHILFR
ncbi:MAG TPA: type II CAAX endopeptidase family protein [Candidatus Acidoferrales bacterium]|nr:type II CAAX endopeptidase family protein [Candidatus Acidoferrales bacterium]